MSPRASAAALAEPASDVAELPRIGVDLLDAHKHNVRSDLGDLTGLTASIREIGVLQPLQVRHVPSTGRYLVIDGHRRLAAAKLAGLTQLPCYVQVAEVDDRVAMLIAALAREDLTALDEARAFEQVLAETGLSQRKLADALGIDQATISRRLTLLKLPEVAVSAVDAGTLSQEDALLLAKADSRDVEPALKELSNASWRTLESTLAYVAQKREQAEQVAALTAPLLAAGHQEASRKVAADHWSRRPGQSWRDDDGDHWQIPLEHPQELACSVFTVHYGGVIWLCADPTQHTKVANAASGGGGRGLSRKELAEQKAREQAQDARRQVCRRLANLPVTPAEAGKRITPALISEPYLLEDTYAVDLAAGWLGLAESGDDGCQLDVDLLEILQSKGERQQMQGLCAVLLAIDELHTSSQVQRHWDQRTAEHLRRLMQAGYALTAWDRKKLLDDCNISVLSPDGTDVIEQPGQTAGEL